MADSTSPLLEADDDQFSEPNTPILHNIPPPTSLDSVIEKLTKNSGFAQFIQAILVSLSSLFDGQQSFISVFSDAQPTWHCTDTSQCSSTSNVCQLSTSAWAWDRPSPTSIISDFNLQCSPSIISGLPASSFFFGCLLGGFILATLADSSLGRKKLLFLSCFIMSVSALITAFSTNVWIYSALRFASGFGRASIGACALVLSTEMMSRKWRGRVGIIGFLCFTLGFLSLPAIAYVNKDSSWRNLYLWTSVPGIIYCSMIFFFVSESPKWLFTQGRKEEAVAAIERFGEANDNMSSMNLYLSFPFPLVEDEENSDSNSNSKAAVDVFASMRNLFKTRWALRRVMMVMVLGVGAGMIYYGMPLGVGSLGFNTYVSVTINALSEIPAYALTFFIIGSCNRRTTLLLFSLISGIGSIMCVVVSIKWKALQIVFELLSFFCGNTAFSLLMIYTLELFPTSVRNSATSMVRQAAVLGATISPMLISAGRNNNGVLSYGVFGVVIIVSGLFVLYLPETRGQTLCDTMEEQERKENAINQNGTV